MEIRPNTPAATLKVVAKRGTRHHRQLIFALVTLVVVSLVGATMPWRESLALPDGLGKMAYLRTETGGADPSARLPLIIDLHALGGMPELALAMASKRAFSARVIAPAAPQWHIFGRSWFSLGAHMVEDTHAAAAQLAEFVRLVTERYPTAGRPIVTGVSQGGSMAFAMAAYYPELFAAAVPVAGALPDGVPEYDQTPSVVVRALHGADDQTLFADWADYTVGQMSEQGWDASLRTFPGSTHKLSNETRAARIDLLAGFAAAEAAKVKLQ